MTDKIFCKRLSDLIKWYDPEFKYPNRTAKDILRDLKNTIENSKCSTCDESDEVTDNEIVIKSQIKKYPPKILSCDICNVTFTSKNRLNHERTDKHKNMLKDTNE